MTIKIYSCAGSRGMRPIWTAEEMGLDYEVEMMPFPPRFLHKDFMDINILGTVPYLIDGEVRMTESVAMSQFMVDRYGPSDLKVATNEDDYGDYLNWLSHSDATLTFPQTVFLRYTLQEIGVADKAAEGYRRWFIARLKLLEQSLNNREYLCSNRFTIADICVSYALFLAKSLGIDEAFKPNISRWTSMLFERKAFKKIKDFSHDEGK
ncbi:glutathione S-transferase family protein [Gammaproteobacteria bacterium]|nr:glutathione S-transferase family protein [Gammaproteobacteria bacterium]MDA7786711.1 glutathione S-transferase family protein [Gammaproteobacteria bacterium]MDA7856133.1 glutathione S-transferase family protein [Gammaproteobacteria bacterium]MDA8856546.1 glutathione S-transferase family protein [Gammaproteobacteria bacterium]MDA8957416.1 glutathione S-transferase family protein [Gammaproteobacteria bacterium]